MPDCLNDDVGLLVADFLGPAVAGVVDDGVNAECRAELGAVDGVDTYYFACAARLDDVAEKDTYWSLSNDRDPLTGYVADLIDGVDHASQRLDDGRLGIAEFRVGDAYGLSFCEKVFSQPAVVLCPTNDPLAHRQVGVAGVNNEHLAILSSIARVFTDKAQVARLEEASTVAEVMDIFGKVNA